MRAKFINEKFTQDSNPIKDMGIGSIDILGDARKILAKGKKLYPDYSLKAYNPVSNYLNKFNGKTVNGIFHKPRFYGEPKEYTFQVYKISTYKQIEYMIIKDEDENEYEVIEGERYIFY